MADAATINVFACPNAPYMGVHACSDRRQCWEPCGDLGHDPSHVRAATPEESAAVDAAFKSSAPQPTANGASAVVSPATGLPGAGGAEQRDRPTKGTLCE